MELALLVLRLIVGSLLFAHGAQKLWGWCQGAGPAATGTYFDSIGLRPGHRMAVLAGTAEVTAGTLLMLGLLTPVAAMLLIAVMTVAVLAVHRAHGPWAVDGGYEYPAVMAAAAFALAGTGAGSWSLDDAFGLNLSGAGWALAAAVIGGLGGLAVRRHARRRMRHTRQRQHAMRIRVRISG